MRRSSSLRDGFIAATVFAAALLFGASAWAQTGAPAGEAVEDAQDTEELEEEAAAGREPRWDPEDEPEDFFGARPLRLTASTGFDFSTGDFGTGTDSDIWYVPFAAKLEWEPFILKLTVPYVRIDGDVILVGDQPQPGPGTGLRDGIGDVVLAASYVYFPGPSVSFLPLTELTYKVKFGTADDDKGLGTGEIDHTLQLDLSKRFGMITPFVGGGYKFIGDPPGINLKNKGFAYLGLTGRVLDWLNLGMAYDWSQSTVRGGPNDRGDFHELSPFASIKIGRHFAIDPYGVIGLSKPAPDWGIGMQLRFIYDFE